MNWMKPDGECHRAWKRWKLNGRQMDKSSQGCWCEWIQEEKHCILYIARYDACASPHTAGQQSGCCFLSSPTPFSSCLSSLWHRFLPCGLCLPGAFPCFAAFSPAPWGKVRGPLEPPAWSTQHQGGQKLQLIQDLKPRFQNWDSALLWVWEFLWKMGVWFPNLPSHK